MRHPPLPTVRADLTTDVERASDHEWDADTDSIPGASDVEVGMSSNPQQRGFQS